LRWRSLVEITPLKSSRSKSPVQTIQGVCPCFYFVFTERHVGRETIDVRFMRCGFLLLAGLCWWLASAAAFGQAPISETAGERDKLQAIAGPFLEGQRICDIARVSLVPGRPADILVSVDASGRYFCNQVLRITTTGRPRIVDYLPTWMLERVADAVADVDADGDNELVLRRHITTYEGADCIATTPVIYECTARTCSDTGDRHQGYLAKALETVEHERDENRRTNPQRYREGLACSIVEADKLRRRLGVDPRAGAGIAEQWMNDSDAKLRRKAVSVFEDIGDADAQRNLAVLSRDRNSSVADLARIALSRK
jgi:hypothetical protein